MRTRISARLFSHAVRSRTEHPEAIAVRVCMIVKDAGPSLWRLLPRQQHKPIQPPLWLCGCYGNMDGVRAPAVHPLFSCFFSLNTNRSVIFDKWESSEWSLENVCSCVTGGVSCRPGLTIVEGHGASVCTEDEQPWGIVGTLSQQAYTPATPDTDERGVWAWYTHTASY